MESKTPRGQFKELQRKARGGPAGGHSKAEGVGTRSLQATMASAVHQEPTSVAFASKLREAKADMKT